MAPEQFEGKEADARSDIWAFGAVLYEMVTGRRAFQGKSYSSLLGAILTADPPPMSMKPFTPAALEKLVRRCLHKDPEDRYQSVRDVLLDLRSIAARSDEVQTPASAARVDYGVIVAAMAVIAAVGGFGWWRATRSVERPLTQLAIRSLAIMPLATVESTPDTEHLSEGLAESLTYSLAQVPDLRVMSRSAVLRQAMPRAGDAIAAGLALGVDGIVTGRISTQGKDLVITVELVEVRSGRNVWGSRYARKGSEVQHLQEEVAGEISGALRVKLSQAQQEQLKRRNSRNGEAYNLYLKGRFFQRRRGPEDMRKSIEYFEKSIDLDPNYALAHAGLADAWLFGDHSIPPSETTPKAKRMAARAVQLDSRLAEAHVSMAMVKFVIDWDWQAAEAEFRKAIECDPNDVEAHRNFGIFQLRLGRTEKAMTEFLRAVQLDPANTLAQLSLANALYWSGHYREAVAEFHKTLEMNPDYSAAHIALGLALSEMGEHGDAVRELQAGFQRSQDDCKRLRNPS
jgi:TolB-like protein/Tfp pilus assembly protein PilF